MKKNINRKLVKKVVILVVMIGAIFFIASNNRYIQTVDAAGCCEACLGDGDPTRGEDACGVICNFTVSPSQFGTCFNNCFNNLNQCYSHCVYCSGTGPNGECNSNSDCPINQFCGADNQCQYY